MKKIVIFTGAGISVPLGLPSTDKFKINSNNRFMKIVMDYLKKRNEDKDIEKILSTIQEFIDFEFIKEICSPIVAQYNNTYHANPKTQLTYKDLYEQAQFSLFNLKKEIYQQLSNFDEKKALSLYQTLFKSIFDKYKSKKISYITTNYDLSLDKVLENNYQNFNFLPLNNYQDYFEQSKFGASKYKYIPLRTEIDYFEYIKLHGSLDWHNDNGICKKTGTSTTPDNPESMYIIYPGDKLIPDDEPFASLHHIAYERMMSADEIIVIGFAFRDKAINYIFHNLLLNNKIINVVNPLDIDKYPKDSKFPFFYDNFQNQIKYHQEYLEIDKSLSFLQ